MEDGKEHNKYIWANPHPKESHRFVFANPLQLWKNLLNEFNVKCNPQIVSHTMNFSMVNYH